MKMLDKINFPLCEDLIEEINASFVDGDWITLFDQKGLFAIMINESKYQDTRNSSDWIINYANMRPSFDYDDGEINVGGYKPWGEEGVSPLIITQESKTHYAFNVRFADEFVFFYNLYTVQRINGDIEYYQIDENGDEILVAKGNSSSFVAKKEYIYEFIAIRNLYLIIQFEYLFHSEKMYEELNFPQKKIVCHYLDCCFDYSFLRSDHQEKPFSIIRGYCCVSPDKRNVKRLWDYQDERMENFIIGVDPNGKNILSTCDEAQLPWEPTDSSLAWQGSLVCFQKSVLDKYFRDSSKYTIHDGAIWGPSWFVRMDNEHDDKVVVLLKDLGDMPFKEQQHWRRFNVPSKQDVSLSPTTFTRWVLGEACDPSVTSDLILKRKYEDLNEKWERKFGFRLFLPLAPGDMHYYDGLHCMNDLCNDAEFDHLVLSVTKVIIDSLNEKELMNCLDIDNSNVLQYVQKKGKNKVSELSGGINRLEAFFIQQEFGLDAFVELLRKTQDLRSTTAAHRKSTSPDKKQKDLLVWFGMDKYPHKDVIDNIYHNFHYQFETLITLL